MNESRTNIEGFYAYGYACSSTPAAFIKVDSNVGIGISFSNIQVCILYLN
jgi:hypothetical protein